MHERLVEGHRGADLHLFLDLLRRQSEVDEQVVERGQALLLLFLHDVDGLGADQSDELPGLAHDHHALGDQGLRVEAAAGIEAQEAIFVDEADEETDFVHVSGEHDLLPVLLQRALLQRDEVAHRIDFDLVHERFEFAPADVPDRSLETGRGDGFGQFLQKIHGVVLGWCAV